MTPVQAFNTEECKPPELLNSRVGSLSSADDLLNIIVSKEGLQNSVNLRFPANTAVFVSRYSERSSNVWVADIRTNGPSD
jgi:hypothetical protein